MITHYRIPAKMNEDNRLVFENDASDALPAR